MTFTTLRRISLWLALLGAAGCTIAHDWPTPGSRVPPPQLPQMPDRVGWRGTLWAGPASGPPAAPRARDCQRSTQPFDVPGPELQSMRRRGDAMADGMVDARALAAAPRSRAESRSADASDASVASKSAAAIGAAESAVPMFAPPSAFAPAPQVMQPGQPWARPADEPVTAGVTDDNADFGAYLTYRSRARQAGINVRDRDITERYRLSVHDAAGRPVPDALVSVHAGSTPRPLWARTDAGGEVWLHPRAAGINDAVLEVRVSKPGVGGELQGSARLRRGQRDALQVRLDANVPVDRARLDIAFLVDATGSMGDEIDKLKRSMQSVAAQIARLPGQPDVCFALVAYRDRGDEFFVRALDFTNDLDSLQRQLNALRAAGGGDYPEALNEALHTAVHRLSWRDDGATRLLLLVADAPPHLDYGAPWYDDDMQGALARGIKLFTLAASGLDKSGEYIYRQLAQYTGGRFVFLTYDKAREPSSGPGRETVHDVGNYSVETLDRLVVRLVREELARRPA